MKGICLLVCALFLSPTIIFANNSASCCGSWFAEVEPFQARVTDDFFRHHSLISSSCESGRHNDDDAFGIRLAVGYDYLNGCPRYYGWSVEYTHFDLKDNKTSFSDDGTLSAAAPLFFGFFNNVQAHFNTHYDTVDVLVHRHACFSPCFDWQAFGGLHFVRIEENLTTHFEFDPAPSEVAIGFNQTNLDQQFKNEFRGLGLQLGLRADYLFTRSLGVTGQIAGDVIGGSLRRHSEDEFAETTLADSGIIFDTTFSHERPDRNRVIPEVSGKLGLTYHGCFNCQKVLLDVGYRIDHYFNIFEEETSACPCGGGSTRSRRDFEFQGPYLSVSWHF